MIDAELWSYCDEGREPFALAKIIRTLGSSPREVGSQMLVTQSGKLVGTIGGGCGEAEVYERCLASLKTGRREIFWVDLTQGSSQACGGRFAVLILPIVSDFAYWRDLFEKARISDDQRGSVLAWSLGSPRAGFWQKKGSAKSLDWKVEAKTFREWSFWLSSDEVDEQEEFFEREGQQWWLERRTRPRELYVYGAGHIAHPLSSFASQLGFRVTVVDDRAFFARPDLFSEADEVCHESMSTHCSLLDGGVHQSVVLVTRGHEHDVNCLLELVGKRFAYIGMIGSRKRTATALKLAQDKGADSSWLEQVYAPIGLDIGACTPEEIALSIVAEILAVERGGQGGSLSLRKGPIHRSVSKC